MSRKHYGRRMRDFSHLNSKYIHRNYLKYLKLATREAAGKYDLSINEIMVLFFLYDLEFFTIGYVAEELSQSKKKFGDRTIYPLQKKGYIEKAYTKSDSRNITGESALFYQETRNNYRNRYCLSKKARLTIQRIYRKLEGDEPINLEE